MEGPPHYAGWKQRDGGNVIYRCWAADGHLLYVGVTNSFDQRMWHHRNGASWWREVADVTQSPVFPDRDAALEAERLAIWTEIPLYNEQLIRPRGVGT